MELIIAILDIALTGDHAGKVYTFAEGSRWIASGFVAAWIAVLSSCPVLAILNRKG